MFDLKSSNDNLIKVRMNLGLSAEQQAKLIHDVDQAPVESTPGVNIAQIDYLDLKTDE